MKYKIVLSLVLRQRMPSILLDHGKPKGPKPDSRVDEATKRAILMLKESNREYGCERIEKGSTLDA